MNGSDIIGCRLHNTDIQGGLYHSFQAAVESLQAIGADLQVCHDPIRRILIAHVHRRIMRYLHVHRQIRLVI